MPTAEYSRQWRLNNPEKVKVYRTRYRSKPEAKLKEKEYYNYYNKTEIHKLAQKKWYLKNAEQEKIRVAEWRRNNRDRNLEYKRKYLQDHLEQHRLRESKRRALKFNAATGNVNLEELKKQKNCGICSKPLNDVYQIDHIIPLTRGGSHSQDNLQLAHPFCNNSKNNKLMEELCV